MLILCLLLGFSISAAANEPIQRGGSLVVALRAEPKTLNPVIPLDSPSREVIGRINADLISIDRSTRLPVPMLAQSWQLSTDGRHFNINLRKGIRFSDGHPFDADDVVFTFKVYLDEKVNSPQRDLLVINGAPIQVQKLGQYQVQIDLPGPYAVAERIFDGLAMLPRHLLQKVYESRTLSQAWALNTAPDAIAGLGPFRLKEYRQGDRLVLERNPYYLKDGKPYLGTLTFLFVGDEDAQIARFLSGETDLMNRVSPKNALLLRSRGFTVDDVGPSVEYNFLFFNMTAQAPAPAGAWFGDRSFRQAVSAAIDRPSIVKLIYAGLATPLSCHITPGNEQWAIPGNTPAPASLEKARTLLRDAGFHWNDAGQLVDSKGHNVEFTILTSSSSAERSQMATLIQDDLKKVGMTVHVVNLEFRSMVDRVLKTHQYDAAIFGLGGNDGDPNSEMNVWLSSGGMHLWSPQEEKPATPWEAEIDSLMRKQEMEMDFQARKRLIVRLQEIEMEQLPIISLVSPHVLVARGPRVRNLRPVVLEHYTLWNADELFVTGPAEARP